MRDGTLVSVPDGGSLSRARTSSPPLKPAPRLPSTSPCRLQIGPGQRSEDGPTDDGPVLRRHTAGRGQRTPESTPSRSRLRVLNLKLRSRPRTSALSTSCHRPARKVDRPRRRLSSILPISRRSWPVTPGTTSGWIMQSIYDRVGPQDRGSLPNQIVSRNSRRRVTARVTRYLRPARELTKPTAVLTNLAFVKESIAPGLSRALPGWVGQMAIFGPRGGPRPSKVNPHDLAAAFYKVSTSTIYLSILPRARISERPL